MPLSAEATQRTARAISAGSSSRPKGSVVAALSMNSGSPDSSAWSLRSLSESVQPMSSWFTRMRLRISAKPAFRVSVASAPLEAL